LKDIAKLITTNLNSYPESISGDIDFLYSSDCAGLNDEESYWLET